MVPVAVMQPQPEGKQAPTGIILRKTFKYRLYPTRKQAAILTQTLALCRQLYNGALQERRDAWKQNHISISFSQQSAQLPAIKEECSEYESIYSQVLQDVLHRVDRTFKAFFRRMEAGEKSGYPRFKGHDRYNSLSYPQLGFEMRGNRLSVSKIGAAKIKLHRPVAGVIKTLTLKRACGRWYAVFSCLVETNPLPPCDAEVGIDVGLESFATTSEGEHIANPRWLREAEEALARAQQRLSRRKRGGHRRRKAARLVARHHERVMNRRRDFHHQVARRLVNTYGAITVEDLRIMNMVRNHSLAKSISDAGWGQFISILQAKAEEAAREVILVNPSGTSQVCSGCGAGVPKPLSERWHLCPLCGLSIHRDLNASRNILRLGRSLQVMS